MKISRGIGKNQKVMLDRYAMRWIGCRPARIAGFFSIRIWNMPWHQRERWPMKLAKVSGCRPAISGLST